MQTTGEGRLNPPDRSSIWRRTAASGVSAFPRLRPNDSRAILRKGPRLRVSLLRLKGSPGPCGWRRRRVGGRPAMFRVGHPQALVDRKSVVEGKRVSVRVDLGGRRFIKKNKSKKPN